MARDGGAQIHLYRYHFLRQTLVPEWDYVERAVCGTYLSHAEGLNLL